MLEILTELLELKPWIHGVVISAVLAGGVALAKLVVGFVGRKQGSAPLRAGLRSVIGALAVAAPVCVSSGWAPFTTFLPMDLLLAVCFSTIFYLSAVEFSPRYQLVTIAGPLVLVGYFIGVMTYLGQPAFETAFGVLVIYPTIIMVCSGVVLVGLLVQQSRRIRQQQLGTAPPWGN